MVSKTAIAAEALRLTMLLIPVSTSDKWVDKVHGKERRFKSRDNPCSASALLVRFAFNCAMFKTIVPVLAVLFFPLFPVRAQTQCNDQQCRNLQAIFDEAVIDFRGYRANKTAPGPDVSIEGTAVPCQMSLWANNVPMYICYAKVPNADSQKWYAKTLQALQILNPTWQFQISSSGEDHYVDAGPPNCEIPPNDGPHRGQCPLHLQTMKQSDGTAKLYLWMNSISSPYLLKPPPPPPSKAVSSAVNPAAAPTTTAGCDEFCQNLKKAFEARVEAFAGIRAAKGNDGTSEATLKLAGAKQCSVKEAAGAQTSGLGTQFVCYWRENSDSAAETRFRDLISRLEILIPSNWSTHQENELDDSTGAQITAWYAVEPDGKHDVRVYVSAESVGLHVTARN